MKAILGTPKKHYAEARHFDIFRRVLSILQQARR